MTAFRAAGRIASQLPSLNWEDTPLGALTSWPACLHQALALCLEARTPAVLWWGRECVLLHNDAQLPLLKPSIRSRALGRRGREAWPDVWPVVDPIIESLWADGAFGSRTVEHDLICQDHDIAQERVFSFTYCAVRDSAGNIQGVLGLGTDVTATVIGARRLQLLEDLSSATSAAKSAELVCQRAADVLARASRELPFVLIYGRESSGSALRLIAAVGVPSVAGGDPPDAASLLLSADELDTADGAVIELADRSDASASPVHPGRRAYVRTLRASSLGDDDGCIVFGLDSRRKLDAGMREYLDRIVGRVMQALHQVADRQAAARARVAIADANDRRAALLSHLTHELRTPLNAILGWAQVLESGVPVPAVARKGLDAIQRNAWRQKHALDELAAVTNGTTAGALRPDPLSAGGSPPPAQLRGLRVVVLDDEPDVRMLLGQVFADAGADAVLVPTVEQAIESVRRQPPHVIVSDLAMPGANGYTLLRRLRALPRELGGATPVIALTASVSEDEIARALAAGFAMHLSKPVDRRVLLSACVKAASRPAAPDCR